MLLPALLAMAAAPAVLSIVGWLPVVAAIAFVMGVAGAGAQLALFDAFMRRMPAEHGVTFSSVDQSIQNLAFVLAPNAGRLPRGGVRGARIAAGRGAASGSPPSSCSRSTRSVTRARRAAARQAVEAAPLGH